MLTRRQAIQTLLLPSLLPFKGARADSFNLGLHNEHGNKLLNSVLQDPSYWSDVGASTYEGEHYDEIRLSSGTDGYLAYITGEGKQSFKGADVAETIFQEQ